MSSRNEYSVWLMPDGELGQTLASLITRLSREFSGPLFPPHVTLIGQLTVSDQELISHSQTLAARLAPFDLVLGNVDYLAEYFRCLFVRIEETPPLLEANTAAREIFGRTGDPPFMPHLSLIYGNFPPETKESIIQSIGHHIDHRFKATHLYLYSTYGDPKSWRRLGKIPLNNDRD